MISSTVNLKLPQNLDLNIFNPNIDAIGVVGMFQIKKYLGCLYTEVYP